MFSEEGWRQAKTIGRAIAAYAIPVGEVISSEYCRAWQTADLALGQHRKDPAMNFEPAEDYTEAQTAAMSDRLVPLLSAEPPQGSNTVLVGHDDPFEAATGLYPEPMGVTYVIEPQGNGQFEIIGMIPPDLWPDA
jgi:phosphohistidine phosphatase SixA